MQPSVLRRRAGALLQNAVYNPKKLVLIHAAITIGGYLLVDILDVLLSWKISQTGGLSGIELRSMFAPAQQLLNIFLVCALPFWNMGLLFAGLRWARAESPMPNDLLDGFRRFGPIFRLRLFQAALIFCISIGISNISYIIFLLTPFADSFIDQMNGLMEQSGASGLITEEQTLSLMQDALPLMIIFGVILAIVLIFLFYRMRFADFFIMEERSALRALVKSFRITKKNCWKVLKVDLSFWWYYLLQILSIAIGNGSLFLATNGLYGTYLFVLLSFLAQLILAWRCQSKVLTTYGLVFETLCQQTFAPQIIRIPLDTE